LIKTIIMVGISSVLEDTLPQPVVMICFWTRPLLCCWDLVNPGTKDSGDPDDRLSFSCLPIHNFPIVVHTKLFQGQSQGGQPEEEQELSCSQLASQYQLVGDVTNRDVVIVDDMIDSGNRMIQTSKLLKEHSSAHRVFALSSRSPFPPITSTQAPCSHRSCG